MKKIDYQNLTADDYKTFFKEFRGCCLSDIRRNSKGYASIINDIEIIKTLKNGVIILDNDITEEELQERAKDSGISPYTKEDIECAINKGYIITVKDNQERYDEDERVMENGRLAYSDDIWTSTEVIENAMRGKKPSNYDIEILVEEFEDENGREPTESEKYELSTLGYIPDPKDYIEQVEGYEEYGDIPVSEEIQKGLEYKVPFNDFWYVDKQGFYSLRYE